MQESSLQCPSARCRSTEGNLFLCNPLRGAGLVCFRKRNLRRRELLSPSRLISRKGEGKGERDSGLDGGGGTGCSGGGAAGGTGSRAAAAARALLLFAPRACRYLHSLRSLRLPCCVVDPPAEASVLQHTSPGSASRIAFSLSASSFAICWLCPLAFTSLHCSPNESDGDFQRLHWCALRGAHRGWIHWRQGPWVGGGENRARHGAKGQLSMSCGGSEISTHASTSSSAQNAAS